MTLQRDVQDCLEDAKCVLVLAADVIWVDELVLPLINTLDGRIYMTTSSNHCSFVALLYNSDNSFLLAYQERSTRVTEHFKQGLESVGITLTTLKQQGKVAIYKGRRRKDKQ